MTREKSEQPTPHMHLATIKISKNCVPLRDNIVCLHLHNDEWYPILGSLSLRAHAHLMRQFPKPACPPSLLHRRTHCHGGAQHLSAPQIHGRHLPDLDNRSCATDALRRIRSLPTLHKRRSCAHSSPNACCRHRYWRCAAAEAGRLPPGQRLKGARRSHPGRVL